MKQIHITRMGNTVQFETVSIDPSETVFFTNQDTEEAHFPSIAANQVGPAPSPNSSQCPLPFGTPPGPFTYTCNLHGGETGTINVLAQLAAVNTSLKATRGQEISPPVQVVTGGRSTYKISGQAYQIGNGNPVQGSIGPGLQLNPSTDSSGITVSGKPMVVGTYNFTFTVNDADGRNLQQVQYTMVVSS